MTHVACQEPSSSAVFPELIIGIALVLIGILLIVFRRLAERVMRGGLRRIYGEGVADEAGSEKAALRSFVAVGIAMICFGIFTVIRSFPWYV